MTEANTTEWSQDEKDASTAAYMDQHPDAVLDKTKAVLMADAEDPFQVTATTERKAADKEHGDNWGQSAPQVNIEATVTRNHRIKAALKEADAASSAVAANYN
ncbi:hypothetical protein HGB25_03435 [Candidatus Saccharibacteria bacterium]|nr:hypothetical protein [Candidatus Saccharibacteria bacterium]